MLRGFTICVAKDRHFIFYLREEAQYIMKNNLHMRVFAIYCRKHLLL
nr:MAG TPA: hypothetical protein [Caudoviricetes sp.]